ncbi:MFS transporter [Marimonas lutisalis]|uniref:MFS transporter n=1 Tax=Marimonas lutisalis TaxID=2545756 RepID=UPI0010F8D007|nr:MFS transporter [Marimonas lutisalis]
MIAVLLHPVFGRLFAAQVVALLGTGLLTVALGLLAYELAGARAGVVLGAALTIKMVAYVGLSPVLGALVAHWPRKAVLVGTDLVRAAVALCLPFVSEVWQVYALVFVLQAASATFTPAFQATIPDVLPEEEDYTRALSLSRLAYDLENLLSPALAGVLLLVMSFHWLFLGTVTGFLGSAVLVLSVALPRTEPRRQRPFRERLTRGIRIYLATPRLRGLLALNFAAAAVGAFVLVNSVVIVRGVYGGSEADLALAMAGFGGGSMVMALVLPQLLHRVSDRRVMMQAGAGLSMLALAAGLFVVLLDAPGWRVFWLSWVAVGALYAAVLTPAGRLLRRSAHEEDRPAIFAAQFALSHACWLIAYPFAGWAGATLGLGAALALAGAAGVVAVVLAGRFWPEGSGAPIVHEHPDLPPDHPHLKAHGGRRHAHVFVIDDEHRAWPTQG